MTAEKSEKVIPIEKKSITFTYREMSHPIFQQTMRKLSAAPAPLELANRMGKIIGEIQDGFNVVHGEYTKDIVEKFAKRDDKGEIVYKDESKTDWERDEAKVKELEKAEEDFHLRTYKIERKPFRLHEIALFHFPKERALSSVELKHISPLYNEN